MKLDWTAAEIAGALNVSARTIHRRSEKEGWNGFESTGRGGKITRYMTLMLPEKIRLELAAACAASDAPTPCGDAEKAGAECAARILKESAVSAEKARIEREKALAGFNALPEKTRRLAEARLDVIMARRSFIQASKLPKRKASTIFCREFRAGNIRLGEETLKHFRKNGRLKLGRATLDRWESAYKARGMLGLANGYSSKAKTSLTPEMQAYIRRMIFEYVHVSHSLIYRLPDN